MHSNRVRLLLAILFALTVALSACGNSSSDEAASETDPSADGGDDSTGDGEDGVDDDGDSETASDDSQTEPATLDGLVEEPVDLSGPVDPLSITSLIQALTGAIPTDDEASCLLDITENDSLLTEVFNGFGQPTYQLTPEGFTALAVNTHSCVNQETLVDSLGALSVLEGDANTEFRTCIGGQIGDETNGDLAYTGLAALLVGFEIPEGATQFAYDAAVGCVTPADLAEQIAFNQESAVGFTVEVDRACLSEGLTNEAISDFWGAFILGEGDGSQSQVIVDSCTEGYDSGLAQELPANWEPWSGTGELAAIDPFARNGVYSEFPPDVLEDGVDYGAILTTGDGDIVLDLYEQDAPLAVNSFVALARDGFYDATTFHRVLAGFMAQGGDPTGTGTGGPGYSFEDDETGLTPIDRRGLLAMANSGADTNGSQFFITFEPADFLNGAHVVFGEVLEGDDVLGEIDLRDPDAPTSRGEEIVSVVITEG